ncbi:MAG: ATP-binding protein [Candidatus Omnitrophota bacterium]
MDRSNYSYNAHAVPVILVSLAIFSIGIFILLQTKKSIKNISFFLLCASMSLWLFATGLVYLSANPQTALLWYKYFTFFGVVSIMPSAYMFSASSSGLLKKQKKLIIGSVFLSCILYGLAAGTDKFIATPRLYFWGYYPNYRPPNLVFILFYLILFVAIQKNLWVAYRHETVPIKKNQVMVIIIAFLTAFIASVDFTAKVFPVSVYPFGFVPIFIFTCLLAYSVIRYKAFDIETAIHKTIAWFFTSAALVAPLAALLYFTRDWYAGLGAMGSWAYLGAALLCFLFFVKTFQPRVDSFFQKGRVYIDAVLDKFTEDLIQLKGLEDVARKITDTITGTINVGSVELLLYDEASNRLVAVGGIKDPLNSDTRISLDDPFLKWLSENDRIVDYRFVEIDPMYEHMRPRAKEYFKKMRCEICVPLVLDKNLIGAINLGRKYTQKPFSLLDYHFLTRLKNQSTIAVSNSLVYDRVEELVKIRTGELVRTQQQLIQAEKLATVGTLAGGVAHEINNPLAAILTNAQMLLMTAENKDDRESLELIEEATKRCRNIVQKLMVYSRKPLGGRTVADVDLKVVINNVAVFLEYQLKQENINIITDIKDAPLKVKGSQNELEQVFTNLILNSKDAIKAVKKGGDISISASKDRNRIKIEVHDEGTGIPEDKLDKIFDPFFTTKDVGKGTGLGLSICQSIIDAHGGTIKAISDPGKGATFLITLPLSKRS